jgi:hypothetical protein
VEQHTQTSSSIDHLPLRPCASTKPSSRCWPYPSTVPVRRPPSSASRPTSPGASEADCSAGHPPRAWLDFIGDVAPQWELGNWRTGVVGDIPDTDALLWKRAYDGLSDMAQLMTLFELAALWFRSGSSHSCAVTSLAVIGRRVAGGSDKTADECLPPPVRSVRGRDGHWFRLSKRYTAWQGPQPADRCHLL